jgi:hypothetical protein
VPTFPSEPFDGGHGASAPLPTLRSPGLSQALRNASMAALQAPSLHKQRSQHHCDRQKPETDHTNLKSRVILEDMSEALEHGS